MSARTLIEAYTPRYIYIGVVDSHGAVSAWKSEYFRDSESRGETPTHAAAGLFHGSRWRYRVGTNSVFWWQQPDPDEINAVDSYLSKHGGHVGLKHRTMMDGSAEDELSAGHTAIRHVPERYRMSEAGSAQPFPGSKVQQLVYHGTGQKFRRFRRGTQGIIWFTSNLESIKSREVGAQGHGYVVSAYINVQKPAGWEAYDKLLLAQFPGEGLDGAVLPNQNGFDAFVFNPDQVRIVEVLPL